MVKSNFTILAVDDKKENLDIILDMLNDYDIIPILNGQKALKLIKEEDISLVLLDIVMPELDGFEICKLLKNDASTQHIPVIFITAKTDEISIAKAYEAGGDDYVSKPLKKTEIRARVKTQLKLRQMIEHLEFLASNDSMTGVFNRRKFFELANPLFNEKKENTFIGMIDIDYFKKVNDTYGHDVGDMVIKSVAKIVGELIDSKVIFARIGGEEFVLMCNHLEKTSFLNMLDSIRELIENFTLKYNDSNINVTVSIGASEIDSTTKTIDELLKQADLSLYEAKSTGRNRVVLR